MATTNYSWPLPAQTTSPPDVVSWLSQGLNAADATVKTTNNRILYGTVAALPTTLGVGVMYLGY